MGGTEIVNIVNPSETEATWCEVADGSHDIVQFQTGNANGNQIYVGDDIPTDASPNMQVDGTLGNPQTITVENANAKVWLRLTAGNHIFVMRGTGSISSSR